MNSISAERPLTRRPDHDQDWHDVAQAWDFPEGLTNLNHGSFGPPPAPVREVRLQWMDVMDRQPMEFFVRRLEPAQREARQALGSLVGSAANDLAFVDNATYGMNVVANSFPLAAGDEVLINNHEYGAVHRIWQRACRKANADLVNAYIRPTVESKDQIIAPLVEAMTKKTRLLVISHITSATAINFPLEELIAEAKSRGIVTVVDGPHAIAQLPLNLSNLGCDFYTASCHKWLCAGFGSGFLYASPEFQELIAPPILSWGRLLPAVPERWDEEFLWRGTGNLTASLTLPAAIDFLAEVGWESFRQRSHWLAQSIRGRLLDLLQTAPCTPDSEQWYGCMARAELPPGDWSNLQNDLKEKFGIEIPVIHFDDRWFIRVSCHLYTMTRHLDHLMHAVEELVVKS